MSGYNGEQPSLTNAAEETVFAGGSTIGEPGVAIVILQKEPTTENGIPTLVAPIVRTGLDTRIPGLLQR